MEVKLSPIKETPEDYEELERKIRTLFLKEIYRPIAKILGSNSALVEKSLKNSSPTALGKALQSGRVQFNQGKFTGKINASISKELKALGAKWDRREQSWKIPLKDLPYNVSNAIRTSEWRFNEKLKKIDEKLSKILPEEFADKLKVEHVFDRSIFKVDKSLQQSMKSITVAPQLSDEARNKLASEWSNNMKKWITDFTETEIRSLRKDIQASVFAGNRYESAVKSIQKSYGVSDRKAKFLARQETGLLMAKFKESRYVDAGSKGYIWRCVSGTKNHPVRPAHKALDHTRHSWDNPPITTMPGEPQRRNHPGEDYNCRCYAVPIVDFKGENRGGKSK